MNALQPLVGEWTIEVPFASGHGTLSFEWLKGEQFLVQRWTVPVAEAPDGIVGAAMQWRRWAPRALLRESWSRSA